MFTTNHNQGNSTDNVIFCQQNCVSLKKCNINLAGKVSANQITGYSYGTFLGQYHNKNIRRQCSGQITWQETLPLRLFLPLKLCFFEKMYYKLMLMELRYVHLSWFNWDDSGMIWFANRISFKIFYYRIGRKICRQSLLLSERLKI